MRKNQNLILESDYLGQKSSGPKWKGSGVSTLRDRRHQKIPILKQKRQSSDYDGSVLFDTNQSRR